MSKGNGIDFSLLAVSEEGMLAALVGQHSPEQGDEMARVLIVRAWVEKEGRLSPAAPLAQGEGNQ